jgi:TetR/AcrR family transcriptional regulator, lmrAB and yxaGH operons repressor
MPRTSDAKQRMVAAARELMREQGYHATAFSDVLQLSGAPRGSVYFHFPGGKSQLATAAADAHAQEQLELIDRVAEGAGSAAELVGRYVDLGRDGMVRSGYARGCGVAPLVTEGATEESPEIAATCRVAFTEMIDRLSGHLEERRVPVAEAHTLAEAVIAGVEGAMVTSRALRSPAPYDALRTVLVEHATALTAGSRGRRGVARQD